MSRLLLAMTLAAFAPPTVLGADWTSAGGDLFVRPAATVSAPQDGADSEARLPRPRQPFDAEVAEAAARHGLDPKLLHAVTLIESAYRPGAVSPAGAAGLTQLMPMTALELGVADRLDPSQNLAGGADYLARQIRRFGDLRLGLAAYNAGPARVARLGRVPDIPETQAYVDSVVDCFLALTAGRTVRGAADCASPAAANRAQRP